MTGTDRSRTNTNANDAFVFVFVCERKEGETNIVIGSKGEDRRPHCRVVNVVTRGERMRAGAREYCSRGGRVATSSRVGGRDE